MTIRYSIKDWDQHFEGSKSRNYSNKTTASMPCKHGLGYRLLIKTGGAECFGAWCALVQVLSRHKKPRNGHVTVDGKPDSRPYTVDELTMLTDIPAKTIEKMLSLVSSKDIAWVTVTKDKDTAVPRQGSAVPCEGTIVPLNSDSDSDSDSDKTASRCLVFDHMIPESLRDGRFIGAWHEWMKDRRDRKHPITERAASKQFKKLERFGLEKAIEAIDTAIERGWTGIFDPDEGKRGQKRESVDAREAAMLDFVSTAI